MDATVLNPREREVLKAIIQDHILTAEPIGSRTISRRHALHLSPASIRNIMADLEELGFLAQPHTSAGRVPTDRGYRVYVDSLMEPEDPSPQEAQRLQERVETVRGEAEELLRETGRILSALTNYTCVVMAPRLEQNNFRRIEFVDLGRDRLLVVFVSASGLVLQKVVTLDEPIGGDELERIARYLDQVLEGKTLAEVRAFVVARMAEEKTTYDRLLARALSLAQKALEDDEVEVFVDGAAHITRQPEFADVEKMRAIFAAFEEKSKLVKILDACLRNVDVTVIIGNEVPVPDLAGLSLIVSPYRAGGAVVGAVGLVGPTRMPYARMVPLVGYTAGLVSRVLAED
ncbi:MAG TPA: heat-inducible transcriptional repressor HrcA [Candidatus Sulfotelmatobacter sp.]|nr:heat-inducible transcriptional repressor HrcA [Candidatus Sulfotelmatobacter sp.]